MDSAPEYHVVGKHRRAGNRRNLIIAVVVVVTVVILVLTIGLAVGLSGKKDETKGHLQKRIVCPVKKDVYPLLLISMDGFRPDYLKLKKTPNIEHLINNGVEANYLVSQFPTKTFPNHYSIVTGLYPESHGIVSNRFYDRNLSDLFRIGGKTMNDAKWWWGEPIWLTVMKAGLSAATYFWPGSEAPIGGLLPNHTMKYNKKTPFKDRVDTILSWLRAPVKSRPTFLTLYMYEPDSSGHRFGPDPSPQLIDSLVRVDKAIGQLVDGLRKMDMLNCINLLVVSDHGMSSMDCSRVSYLDKYNIPLDDVHVVEQGPLVTLSNKLHLKESTKKMVEDLQCAQHLSAYSKEEMPKRLHYSNNRRIEDVIVISDTQWVTGLNSTAGTPSRYCTGGTHGYDNQDTDMRSIFIAHGPSFKEDFKTEHFANIELYNLMAGLLKLNPATNNGTSGSLNHILWNTDSVKVMSSPNIKNMMRTDICKFPENYKGCSTCICPYCDNGVKNNIPDIDIKHLDIPAGEIPHIENRHFPWGVPQGGAGDGGCLLYQRHYITGYSYTLHIPLWVGHMMNGEEAAKNVPRKNCFRSDPRLPGSMGSNCTNYYKSGYDRGHMVANADLDWDTSSAQSTFLLSNVVPQIAQFNRGIWLKLETMVRDWAKKYKEIYVISGCIFDSNADGLRDPDSVEKSWLKNQTDIVAIPTHFYKLITRCNTEMAGDYKAHGCNGKLEVISFVLPHCAKPACKSLSDKDYLLDHLTTVRDIERLTNIKFFTGLSDTHQAQLKTYIPMELWARD